MSDVYNWYGLEIDKLNDLTEARKTFTESMKTVEDELYEMTHTQKENEIKLLNEKKAKLIEIAKQAGLSAQEEIAAIKKILEYYQKELDMLNEKSSLNKKYYDVYNKKNEKIGVMVTPELAEEYMAQGYDVMESAYNPTEVVPGQVLPKLATGTPLVRKAGVAIIDKGEAVLTPEQNKAYQAGAKSYTININNPVVRNDDDISKIRQQFEESMNGLIPEFGRSGNYLVPGMA